MDVFTAWAERNMDPVLSQKLVALPSEQGRHELGLTNDLIAEIADHIVAQGSVLAGMRTWVLPEDPDARSVEYAAFMGVVQNALDATADPGPLQPEFL